MTDFLVADYGIRQLHARYIDAVWRRDIKAFANCFVEDSEWKIAGHHLRGRTDICQQLEKFLSASERVMMFAGTPVLEVGRSQATGRTYVTEYIKRTDGSAARTLGIYYDRYVENGALWQFQQRHLQLCYHGPADFSAPFADCPDYGPHPGMPN